MSNTDSPQPGPDFDAIVDDDTPREEARLWSIEQLRTGRSFDEVLAELMDEGWSPEHAELILEYARQQTRDERGVVTREQVAKATDAYYRGGTGGGIFAGMPTISAMRRLLYSIATLKFLRSKRR